MAKLHVKEPPHVVASKQVVEVKGIIKELLPGATFRVQMESGQEIIGHLAGRMRLHRIHLLPGDQVKVQLTPYDLTKGRIVYRF